MAPGTGDRPSYPKDFRERERALLARRPIHGGQPPADDAIVGIGFSGGGIRSATFCLGVLQGLAQLNLLDRIDYLSSVSGGGYIASMFGRIFSRKDFETGDMPGILYPDEVRPQGRAKWERGLFRWLRENGRYLSPKGAGDLILDLSVLLRNWAALQFVVVTFLLAIFLAARIIRELLSELAALSGPRRLQPVMFWSHGQRHCWIWWSPYILLFLASMLVAGWYGFRYWWIKGSGHDNAETVDERIFRVEKARMDASVRLKYALIVAGGALAFALIDSLGQTLYALIVLGRFSMSEIVGSIAAPIVTIAPFARWLYTTLGSQRKNQRLSLPLNLIAAVGAALVIIPALTLIDGVSHAVAFEFAIPTRAPRCLWKDDAVRFRGTAKVALEGDQKAVTVRAIGKFETKPQSAVSPRTCDGSLLYLAIALVLTAFVSAKMHGRIFLNRSSMLALYSSRLIRAYLGASNESRYKSGGDNVSDVVEGDDIAQQDYWSIMETGRLDYGKGAPIHLVNVTINETVDGRSQLEQRDRKGLSMAIGPAGISAAVNHHVVFSVPQDPKDPKDQYRDVKISPPRSDNVFRIFDYEIDEKTNEVQYGGELLSLGKWVGISGAAISTGLGSRTSLGLSLLLGFFNVRLGFWWDSGIPDKTRERSTNAGKKSPWSRRISRWFPVQTALLNEFLSRFPGVDRQYWNLSDGGHFENLGGYELIRRRLRTIVIVDAEADPDYEFEDLANLIRKARLDFDTEITFLDKQNEREEAVGKLRDHFPEIDEKYFGSLDELRRGRRTLDPVSNAGGTILTFRSSNEERLSLKHAAIAKIKYRNEDKIGYLVLIKPTLVGEEPFDILSYHQSHSSFPHETTADQFFDEAQWESYRKLGEHITMALLKKG